MITAVALFLLGLMLSAFYSGSETGLYRVSRTRLVLDGLDGSIMGRAMVWLLNHPAIFVATTLVGNNVANYMTSLAIVLGVQRMGNSGPAAELLGPILMTPVIFVLGELLPKYLFFHAPYRLLRATQPMLMLSTILFAPVSLLLGLLGSVLQKVTGETPFELRLTMARRELDQVLRAGHEAGLLAGSQRDLVTRLFEIGNQSAISFGVPVDRLAKISQPVEDGKTIDIDAAKSAARRVNHPILLVQQGNRITGFLRYIDLMNPAESIAPQPAVRGTVSESHLKILLRLYDARSDVAVLFNEKGIAKSVVTRRQLTRQLTK